MNIPYNGNSLLLEVRQSMNTAELFKKKLKTFFMHIRASVDTYHKSVTCQSINLKTFNDPYARIDICHV